jgi:hypothetical protein
MSGVKAMMKNIIHHLCVPYLIPLFTILTLVILPAINHVACAGPDKHLSARASGSAPGGKKPVQDEPRVTSAKGNIFYVVPAINKRGKGTKKRPWDLATALSHPGKVQPGDTIYLREGTYRGVYASQLRGTASAPITVRSYPGEWARIDGFRSTTIVNPVGRTDTTIVLANGADFPNGSDIVIDNEVIQLRNKKGDAPATYTECVRARGGGSGGATAHAAGAEVIGRQRGILNVVGSHTIYRDFEVMNSNPNRVSTYTTNFSAYGGTRGDGISIQGPNNKFINLVVHDCADGFGSWADGDNAEVYGCIIFNNGWTGTDRGHGHGLYIQTTAGNNDTRHVIDVISFNNFANGMNAYTERGASERLRFEGVVSFNNGSPHAAGPHGNPTARTDGIFSGVRNGAKPQKHVVVKDSYFYLPPGVTGPNLGLGYTGSHNELAEVTGNYIVGGSQALVVVNFDNLVFARNTIFITPIANRAANAFVFNLAAGSPSYRWDENVIYNAATATTMGLKQHYKLNRANLSFGEWQAASGFDGKSTSHDSRPTGVWVFLRPNQYEQGRVHIIVYNWDLLNEVDVDVSSLLQVGARYEVRSAQDYLGAPALSGTYNGGSLRLPMKGLQVARPVGYDYTPQSTAPEFNVFVLIAKTP